jgi:hypothetical protein
MASQPTSAGVRLAKTGGRSRRAAKLRVGANTMHIEFQMGRPALALNGLTLSDLALCGSMDSSSQTSCLTGGLGPALWLIFLGRVSTAPRTALWVATRPETTSDLPRQVEVEFSHHT